MCQGCFDDAGQPRIRHPAVVVAAMAARGVDRFGACHIVVEDWNVEDSNIDFCLDHPEVTAEEHGWLCFMRAMTEEQRLSALALADGYWSLYDPEIVVPFEIAARMSEPSEYESSPINGATA